MQRFSNDPTALWSKLTRSYEITPHYAKCSVAPSHRWQPMAMRATIPERSTSRELVPEHDLHRPPKQRRQDKPDSDKDEAMPTRVPLRPRKSDRSGRRQRSRQPRGPRNGAQTSQQVAKTLMDLIASVILALLNHEAALRYHHGWIFYATVRQTGSVVPALASIQQKWRSDRAQNIPDTPVRQALFIGLLHELHSRVESFDHMSDESANMDKDTEIVTLASALTIRGRHHTDENPPYYWNYMRWDSKQKKTVVDVKRPPLSPKVVSTQLAAMLKLDQDQLTKLRPSRPLKTNLADEKPVIAFLLELALTIGEDHEAMHAFRLLANNSVWNLIGVTMRREGLRRSPQMQALRDQLDSLRTKSQED